MKTMESSHNSLKIYLLIWGTLRSWRRRKRMRRRKRKLMTKPRQKKWGEQRWKEWPVCLNVVMRLMYSDFKFIVFKRISLLGWKRERDCNSPVPASLDISGTSSVSSLVDLDDQNFDEDNPPPSKKGKGTAVGKCLRFLKELLIVIVYSFSKAAENQQQDLASCQPCKCCITS